MALFARAAVAISSVRAPAKPCSAKWRSAAARIRRAIAGSWTFLRPRGIAGWIPYRNVAIDYCLTVWLVYSAAARVSRDYNPTHKLRLQTKNAASGAKARFFPELHGRVETPLFRVS